MYTNYLQPAVVTMNVTGRRGHGYIYRIDLVNIVIVRHRKRSVIGLTRT